VKRMAVSCLEKPLDRENAHRMRTTIATRLGVPQRDTCDLLSMDTAWVRLFADQA
jgi:hypothetical protein